VSELFLLLGYFLLFVVFCSFSVLRLKGEHGTFAEAFHNLREPTTSQEILEQPAGILQMWQMFEFD